ncbi:MAG: hypothetical protein JRF43_07295, partial [Deltaproteobacteria bacterium]|nr:hypothetical protein [Deltaproteobacteria bacterium]
MSGLQDSMNSNSTGVSLPLPARLLVPHRPPMLIVNQLLERNEDTALAEAIVPTEGIFLDPQAGLLPEYFIELIAQSIAAINGFDARKENRPPLIGYLVGIDNFSWIDRARPGETLQVSIKKTFEFQAVTTKGMGGKGMRLKLMLMLLPLLFIVPPVFAEDNGRLSSFIHDVEAKAATVKTLTCTLKQERHLAIFARPVIFQGRMALEKPDKLRW